MRREGYPYVQEHVTSHQKLYQQFTSFDQVVVRYGSAAALQALKSFTSALFSHIQSEDRAFVEYLSSWE